MSFNDELEQNVKKLGYIRDNVVSFTGHRYTVSPDTEEHMDTCADEIVNRMKWHKLLFVNGGAKGWDIKILIRAFLVQQPFILVLPYKERAYSLPDDIIAEIHHMISSGIDLRPAHNYHHDIFEAALGVYYPLDRYHVSGFHIRDQAMTWVTSELYPYWDGRKKDPKGGGSGTYATIQYALKQSRPIDIYNCFNNEAIVKSVNTAYF